MAGSVFLKTVGAVGALVGIYVQVKGGMPLADVLLIVLVSVLFISMGRGTGEVEDDERVDIEVPAREMNQGILIKGFQKQSLPG